MKKDIYYCIVLSGEQLAYLSGSKYGIDRMKVLHRLIEAAVVSETKYEKKGFSATLHVGQAAFSEVDLARGLGYDKKTVSRVLDRMAGLGIVASKQTNRTSIHEIRCVSAWYVDNQKILNPYYVNMKERHKATATTDETLTPGNRPLPENGAAMTDSPGSEDFRSRPDHPQPAESTPGTGSGSPSASFSLFSGDEPEHPDKGGNSPLDGQPA